MATEQDKRCGTGRHYSVHPGHVGKCNWPVPEWLATWMLNLYLDSGEQGYVNARLALHGTDCPTWAAKDEKA